MVLQRGNTFFLANCSTDRLIKDDMGCGCGFARLEIMNTSISDNKLKSFAKP